MNIKYNKKSIIYLILGIGLLSLVIGTFLIINNKSKESNTITLVSKVEVGKSLILKQDTKEKVTWSTSDSNIATVINGVVIGKKEGTATITATNEKGEIRTYEIVVENENQEDPKEQENNKKENEQESKEENNKKENEQENKKEENIEVKDIKLNSENGEILVGKTVTLMSIISPDNATDKKVTWTSDNEKIATVKEGVVTGVNIGTATITAKTSNGKVATYKVTVKTTSIMPVEVTGITLNLGSASTTVNGKLTLTATISPSNATIKTITWTSSNEKIATVSNTGVVTGVSEGTATIMAKTSNGKTAECKVIVTSAPAKTVDVTGVSLNATNGSIEVGKTVALTATVTPSNATNKSVSWTSSNNNIATVSTSGVITGVSAGTATITVKTNNGKTATYTVTVKPIEVDLGLFWGQSNMVGSVGKRANEQQKDKRDMTDLIDSDIISYYTTMNHVDVPIKPGTAYEFKLGSTTSGSLVELKSSTQKLGEKLIYINGKLRAYKSSDPYSSSSESQGTNMIPQFAKTYNDQTGHILVAVMLAYYGEPISGFLPHDSSSNDKYLYEAMKTKYNMAVNYLETHGYKVKNRFYVVYQGCADTAAGLSSGTKYYDTFMKVHKNIKKDMGITFGAIVESSGRISDLKDSNKKQYIQNIHNQHENLISKNSDIILGSRFAWNAYINKKANAFALVKSADGSDNSIHVTSAGLSQIGKDAAKKVAKKIK